MRRDYNYLRSNNEGWLTSYADLITNLLIFFVLIISASAIQTGRMEKIIQQLSQAASPKSLSSAEQELTKVLKEKRLEQNVRVSMTDEGLELSFDSGVTFASGSAEILASMEVPLMDVLRVLQPYGGKYQMAVEGHTDERPVRSGPYRSNWELASARAQRVRQRLQQVGLPKERIRVESYADNKALPDGLTKGLNQEQRLAKHRRVVVRLF